MNEYTINRSKYRPQALIQRFFKGGGVVEENFERKMFVDLRNESNIKFISYHLIFIASQVGKHSYRP